MRIRPWFMIAMMVIILAALMPPACSRPPKGKTPPKVRPATKSHASKPKPKTTAAKLPYWVTGKGAWIYIGPRCCNGDSTEIAKHAKQSGLDYIAVRTNGYYGWDKKNSRQFVRNLIKACHKVRVKVYAWGYIYPDNPQRVANLANEVLDMGADGYIFNIESAMRNHAQAAREMCPIVRQHVDKLNKKDRSKHRILAYSPPCRVNIGMGVGIPVEVFDYYCDVNMPQVYWTEFKNWDEKNADYRMMTTWLAVQKTWHHQARPIAPILHAYDDTPNTTEVDANELLRLSKGFSGYSGISYYCWDKMGVKHWQAIKKAPGSLAWQKKNNLHKFTKQVKAKAKQSAAAKPKRHERRKQGRSP